MAQGLSIEESYERFLNSVKASIKDRYGYRSALPEDADHVKAEYEVIKTVDNVLRAEMKKLPDGFFEKNDMKSIGKFKGLNLLQDITDAYINNVLKYEFDGNVYDPLVSEFDQKIMFDAYRWVNEQRDNKTDLNFFKSRLFKKLKEAESPVKKKFYGFAIKRIDMIQRYKDVK